MNNETINLPRDKLEAMAFGRMEFDEFSQYMDELQALLGQTATQHQGEPVYQFAADCQRPNWVDVSEESHDEYKRRGGWLTRVLYTRPAEQPAPVAVVLPERKPDASWLEFDSGWNDCLDEVARLNPPQKYPVTDC
ncbi:hypothetical protein [Pseudomonas protegens]|uniref:hypothetical protein n=1 Tax=Pseudomonas protegens TaxID=380021 RepID=UPI001F2B4888|nr:hypothetical protein [Pseudomonas protegens]